MFLNPPDIGGRYCGADVRRARAGEPDRPRPRRRSSPRRWRWLGACREPEPATEPRRQPRPRDRDARQGRPRQADVPARSGDRELRCLGRAAHRREHRQARRRASSRSTASRSASRRSTATIGSSSGCRLSGASGPDVADADAARPTRSKRPATRSSGSTSPTRSTSAARSFRWEVATAIAGAVLGIDPFDQPNVEEAKELTRELLAGTAMERTGRATDAAASTPIATAGGVALFGDAPLRLSADGDQSARRRAAPSPRPAPAERLPRDPGVHRADRGPRRGACPDPGAPPRGDAAARRPPATGRASSTRPASSTRAGRRSAGSSS